MSPGNYWLQETYFDSGSIAGGLIIGDAVVVKKFLFWIKHILCYT